MTPTMRIKRRPGTERLMDAISFRISHLQRSFLEKIAKEREICLCEACRMALDAGIATMPEAGDSRRLYPTEKQG